MYDVPVPARAFRTSIYSQVAHDIRQHVADLLDGRRVELTVSLMEAEPERYATD